jgi:hypothetical protein
MPYPGSKYLLSLGVVYCSMSGHVLSLNVSYTTISVFIRGIKSKNMRLACRMHGRGGNVHIISVGKPEVKGTNWETQVYMRG